MAAAMELDAVRSMSRAGKVALQKDAEDMAEIQRQNRGRLLGDWSDRKPAPKREEVPELVKVKRVPGARPAMLPHGEMADSRLLAAAVALADVKCYGWGVTLSRLAGVSVSVLKRLRLGLPVSEGICLKVTKVTRAEIEAEVAKLLAERRAA
jgi:hypothetical protein